LFLIAFVCEQPSVFFAVPDTLADGFHWQLSALRDLLGGQMISDHV